MAYDITPLRSYLFVSMFICQNVSLEERCAAQEVRRAVAATTTASSATLATATATASSLLKHAGASLFAPHCAPTTTALSATLAAATIPHLPGPAGTSLAGPRPSPGPDDSVPRKFPGERGILGPNMIPFVPVIFSSHGCDSTPR